MQRVIMNHSEKCMPFQSTSLGILCSEYNHWLDDHWQSHNWSQDTPYVPGHGLGRFSLYWSTWSIVITTSLHLKPATCENVWMFCCVMSRLNKKWNPHCVMCVSMIAKPYSEKNHISIPCHGSRQNNFLEIYEILKVVCISYATARII